MFTNIEASLQVTIDNKIDKDKKIIDQLKEYYKGIFDLTDDSLKIISSELIENLLKSGIVPTEAEQTDCFTAYTFRNYERIPYLCKNIFLT